MQQTTADNSNTPRAGAPAWFRYGVVAVAVLILCSCQAVDTKNTASPGPSPEGIHLGPQTAQAVMPAREVLPVVYEQQLQATPSAIVQAQYGAAAECPTDPCQPCGCQACGVVGPRDEYLCDGGDHGLPAGVKADWKIEGLEQEDTVAHYDTVDGRTIITPSNQVCIYAPRFGVVRRVIDLHEYACYDAANGFGQTVALAKIDEKEEAALSRNQLEPRVDRGEDPVTILRERQQAGDLDNDMRLAEDVGALAPYADLQIVKAGTLVGEERVKIARASLAAITWTGDEAPQITIDSRNAVAAVSDRQPGLVYHLLEPQKPCMRLVKLASTGSAKPGEEVEFTLRLDNIGNRETGNVTVADNLTTRLEYVPDSAKCSVAADFSTDPNTGGSEVLRWEIKEPLPAGEGCILQFKCRVR